MSKIKNINMDEINKIFIETNQSLRIIDIIPKTNRSGMKIHLNNNLILEGHKILNSLLIYIKKYKELISVDELFFDKIFSCDKNIVDLIKIKYKHYYSGKASINNKHCVGRIPYNKGKKGLTVSWSKGLNKNTDSRLKKLSEDRMGNKNPMFGTVFSDEYKLQKSNLMKAKILNGEFTPKTNNRLSRWTAEYDGYLFRSSWEAGFYSINKNCMFEKFRIKYFDSIKNKERIYIVDFIDIENKILYEVRPKHLQSNMKDKLISVEKYIRENNFTFVFIDETYIKQNISRIENTDISEEIKIKLRKVK